MQIDRRRFLVLSGGAAGGALWQRKAVFAAPPSTKPNPFAPIKFTTNTPAGRVGSGAATRLVNQIRTARARPKLRYRGTLHAIASAQARAMARKDQMSHHVAGALTDRARRAGYRGKPAENLARKYETLEEVLLAWLHSPSHRTTLLSKRYRYFGLAAAKAPHKLNSKYGVYWAIVLGT